MNLNKVTSSFKKSSVYILFWRSKHFYIGSSVNPERRKQEHKRSCFSNKPVNIFMSRVWKKFKEPNIYILLETPANKVLKWEQLFIDILSVEKYCLNINTETKRPNKWKKKKAYSAK